jgi:hypothetical protein
MLHTVLIISIIIILHSYLLLAMLMVLADHVISAVGWRTRTVSELMHQSLLNTTHNHALKPARIQWLSRARCGSPAVGQDGAVALVLGKPVCNFEVQYIMRAMHPHM